MSNPDKIKKSKPGRRAMQHARLAAEQIQALHPKWARKKIYQEMGRLGYTLPHLNTLSKWLNKARPRRVKPKKPEPVKVILYPADSPEHILKTDCGIVVKRSRQLREGGHIYAVFDARRGNQSMRCKFFAAFLAELEQTLGRPLHLYTERGGKLEPIADGDEPSHNMITGAAA